MGTPHSPNRTPHKHAELIKAWADGAEIQVKDLTNYSDPKDCNWSDFSEFDDMVWYNEWEYRIKPKTIKYRVALHRGAFKDSPLYTINYNSDAAADHAEETYGFVRWLTDWIEVEA